MVRFHYTDGRLVLYSNPSRFVTPDDSHDSARALGQVTGTGFANYDEKPQCKFGDQVDPSWLEMRFF